MTMFTRRALVTSGTALAAAGALVTTGRTGVNHADLMLLLRARA